MIETRCAHCNGPAYFDDSNRHSDRAEKGLCVRCSMLQPEIARSKFAPSKWQDEECKILCDAVDAARWMVEARVGTTPSGRVNMSAATWKKTGTALWLRVVIDTLLSLQRRYEEAASRRDPSEKAGER